MIGFPAAHLGRTLRRMQEKWRCCALINFTNSEHAYCRSALGGGDQVGLCPFKCSTSRISRWDKKTGQLFPPSRITIMMAYLQNILWSGSQTGHNRPLRCSCLIKFIQPTVQSFGYLSIQPPDSVTSHFFKYS